MLPKRNTLAERPTPPLPRSGSAPPACGSYWTQRSRHGLCIIPGVSVGRIPSGQFHTGYAVTPPARACRPIGRAVVCDPTEPISFGDFLASRNRIARENQADRGRLLGNLHRPMPTRQAAADPSLNRARLLPKLGEVLPVEPAPKAQRIMPTRVVERSVRTGSLIDVVI